MTLTSETIAAIETPFVETVKRSRGRPVGVKNGEGVAHKKKPVKKIVKNPRIKINVDAIVANSEVKKLKAEVERLAAEVKRWTETCDGARLHIEKVEKQLKASLVVIGYLEGKLFNP